MNDRNRRVQHAIVGVILDLSARPERSWFATKKEVMEAMWSSHPDLMKQLSPRGGKKHIANIPHDLYSAALNEVRLLRRVMPFDARSIIKSYFNVTVDIARRPSEIPLVLAQVFREEFVRLIELKRKKLVPAPRFTFSPGRTTANAVSTLAPVEDAALDVYSAVILVSGTKHQLPPQCDHR